MLRNKIEIKYSVLKPLVSILIAYVIAILIIFATSKTPIETSLIFITGPFSSGRTFANVIETMIPFIFTGLGIALMNRASQFNLIGEGVFFFVGAVTAYVAINTSFPSIVSPTVLILLSGIIGSLIALIPAILKIRFKANELVSSIMMNYILLNLGLYVLNYHMRDMQAGYNASFKIPLVSKLPIIIPGTRIHFGLVIALLAVAAVSYLVYRTKIGYEIDMVGQNQNFAKYSGIKVVKVILIAQLIGGFLAGVGGSVEILGLYNRFQWEILTGRGFDGVVVASIARLNPILIPVTAFFLAYMRTGAEIVSRRSDIPVEFVNVIQAIVLVLVGAQLLLESYRRREIVKASKIKIEQEAQSA